MSHSTPVDSEWTTIHNGDFSGPITFVRFDQTKPKTFNKERAEWDHVLVRRNLSLDTVCFLATTGRAVDIPHYVLQHVVKTKQQGDLMRAAEQAEPS